MKLIFFVFLLLTESVNLTHIHLCFSQTNILTYLLQAYVYLGILHTELKKIKQKYLPFLESQKMKNKSQTFGINSAMNEATKHFCYQNKKVCMFSLLCENLMGLEVKWTGQALQRSHCFW